MNSDLIMFVHGLGGHPTKTWGKFPQLVRDDQDLDRFDVGFFSYPTSVFRWPFSRKAPRIQTLAEGLRTQLDCQFATYERITLVCHSLGGLIARKYLLDEVQDGRSLRVDRLLLYAVPNNGAGLASVARRVSWRHGQLAQLCRQADLLIELNEAWFRHRMQETIFVRYVCAALDKVVSDQSARLFWGNPAIDVVVDRGHRNVVKPTDAGDLPFLILKDHLRRGEKDGATRPDITRYETKSISRFAFRSGEQALRKTRYRIVGFDLDGTLLRGLEFSWTLVWDHLRFPPKLRKLGMRRYLTGETTYAAWCEWSCRQFRDRGLKRSDFKEITESITPTRNLHEALKILRNDGFLLALVSGGIDVFLEEKLPAAYELFDYVFINRLQFDDQGVVKGIEPTPFDFAGKTTALKNVAEAHGASLANVVFVGEGFNDADVAAKVGLSIAYPPTAIEMTAAASIEIKDDDLLLILEHVM